MRPFEDPSFLTPDQRLSEVAHILATGILRLHARAALPENEPEPAQIPEIPSQSGPPRLDVLAQTGLTVRTG